MKSKIQSCTCTIFFAKLRVNFYLFVQDAILQFCFANKIVWFPLNFLASWFWKHNFLFFVQNSVFTFITLKNKNNAISNLKDIDLFKWKFLIENKHVENKPNCYLINFKFHEKCKAIKRPTVFNQTTKILQFNSNRTRDDILFMKVVNTLLSSKTFEFYITSSVFVHSENIDTKNLKRIKKQQLNTFQFWKKVVKFD